MTGQRRTTAAAGDVQQEVVHDLDDTRQTRYGAYYTQRKPLSLAALKGLPGI